jgi:hypothetical protein
MPRSIWRSAFVFGLLAASCASAPAARPDVGTEAAHDSGAGTALLADASGSAPSTSREAGAEFDAGIAASALAAACVGLNVDVDQVARDRSCDLNAKEPIEETLPDGIVVAVEPPKLPALSGRDVDVIVVFRNTAKRPVRMDLNLSCGDDHTFAAAFRDAKGDVASLVMDGPCGVSVNCLHKKVRIELAPSGEARKRVHVHARIQRFDVQCKESFRPLPRGSYTLEVKTPLQLPPTPDGHPVQAVAKTTIVVR